MKNLGTMFGYEMKKIWKRSLTWAAVLAVMLLTALEVVPWRWLWGGGGNTWGFTYPDGSTVSGYVSDREVLQTELEWAPRLNGQVMDEVFFANLRQSVPPNEPDMPSWNVEAHFLLKDPTYYGFYAYMNLTGDLAGETEERYYAAARNLLEQDLYESWYGPLAQDEIDYWLRLGEQLQSPYVYSYYAGWFRLSQTLSTNVPWLLPLLVGVCLCDIFSKDRATRVQAMALSSREGRFPLYLAKILAGTATVLLTVLLALAAEAISALLIFGGEWFDTPLQIATKTWWPITMGQELLIRLGLLTAFALLCGGAVMLVSLLAGSSVAGLAAGLVMMIQEVLLGLYSDASWLPGNLLGSSMFHRYQLVELFGVQLNCVQLGAMLYSGAAVLLLALCWLGWKRSAVRRF